jgi:hypothetical protein
LHDAHLVRPRIVIAGPGRAIVAHRCPKAQEK